MHPDTAIRSLSFAEARRSGSEALVLIAKHRTELAAAAAENRSQTKADEFADRARDEKRHVVNKIV